MQIMRPYTCFSAVTIERKSISLLYEHNMADIIAIPSPLVGKGFSFFIEIVMYA